MIHGEKKTFRYLMRKLNTIIFASIGTANFFFSFSTRLGTLYRREGLDIFTTLTVIYLTDVNQFTNRWNPYEFTLTRKSRPAHVSSVLHWTLTLIRRKCIYRTLVRNTRIVDRGQCASVANSRRWTRSRRVTPKSP